MRAWWVLVALLATPAAVSAQVHPCDAAPQATPTKGSRVGWCHDRKDVENLLYQAGQLGFKIYYQNQIIDVGVSLQPIGSPSAAGLWYYEVPITNTLGGRGEWSIAVTAYSAEGESLPSTAIVWQIGGPPSVPKNPRVK